MKPPANRPQRTDATQPRIARNRGAQSAKDLSLDKPQPAPIPKRKVRRTNAPPGISYTSIEVMPPIEGHEAGGERPKPGLVRTFGSFTQADRDLVVELSEQGLPQVHICEHIIAPETGRPISLSALRNHFPNELRRGLALAATKLTRSGFRQAIGHEAEYDVDGNVIRPERGPNTQMTIYMLGVRCGYSREGGIRGDPPIGYETSPTGIDLAADVAQKVEEVKADLAQCTDDELKRLRAVLARRSIAGHT